jgi:hypothetical protein
MSHSWNPTAPLALLLCVLLSGPAAAAGAQQFWAGVGLYVLYAMVACCLLGWSFLVTVMVRKRVELTARVLQQRPLASFFMGLLSLGWLILSFVVGQAAGGLGVLLILATLTILILCALIGLPAILVGLGRRASRMFDGYLGLPKQLSLGALILFSAGGFPWLGQLLLIGVLLWSSGGAVLGFFSGDVREPYGTTLMEAVSKEDLEE